MLKWVQREFARLKVRQAQLLGFDSPMRAKL
jgi:hypothetical protein